MTTSAQSQRYDYEPMQAIHDAKAAYKAASGDVPAPSPLANVTESVQAAIEQREEYAATLHRRIDHLSSELARVQMELTALRGANDSLTQFDAVPA